MLMSAHYISIFDHRNLNSFCGLCYTSGDVNKSSLAGNNDSSGFRRSALLTAFNWDYAMLFYGNQFGLGLHWQSWHCIIGNGNPIITLKRSPRRLRFITQSLQLNNRYYSLFTNEQLSYAIENPFVIWTIYDGDRLICWRIIPLQISPSYRRSFSGSSGLSAPEMLRQH